MLPSSLKANTTDTKIKTFLRHFRRKYVNCSAVCGDHAPRLGAPWDSHASRQEGIDAFILSY